MSSFAGATHGAHVFTIATQQAAPPSGGSPWGHILWTVLLITAIVISIVCIPIQRRALNKIAFGRSMFITWTAIIFGFIIALLPNIPATIIALCLFVLGFGMMIMMAVKSYQHLQHVKLSRSK